MKMRGSEKMKAWITYDVDEDGDSIAHIRMSDSYGVTTTVATLPSGTDLTERANLFVGAIQNDTGCTVKDLAAEKTRADDATRERDAFDARCGVLSMRADDLSRTVAAMGEVLSQMEGQFGDGTIGDDARAILSRPDVTAERGRWVPLPSSPWLAGIYSCPSCRVIWTAWGPTTVQPRGSMSCHGSSCAVCEPLDIVAMDRIEVADFIAERNGAITRAEVSDAAARALGDDFTRVLRECADLKARADDYEMVRNALDATIARAEKAEAAQDALGIQLAAQGERLRLAMACVKAGDFVINDSRVKVPGVYAYFEARAALDAVPGDALPHPTRHLEALGIDTDNVKGGER